MLKSIPERLVGSNAAVFVLVALIFGVIAFARPPVQSPDATFYLSLADAIQQGKSEVIFTTEKATWTVVTLPLLLVAAQSITLEHWPFLIVLVNVLSMAAAAALLVALVRMVTHSAVAALAALLFYVAAYDVMTWLRFILTDIIYTCLALATFVIIMRGIVRDEPPARRLLLLSLFLVLCFATRASGAILIPLAIFTEYLASHPDRQHQSAARCAAPWILLAVVAAGIMLARGYFYDDMRRWPTDFLRPILEQYVDREKTGEVVWDRRETARLPPDSIIDHLVIELDRFARFFQFTSSGHSRLHNLVSVAYYVPLYSLAVIGLVHGLRSGDRRRRLAVQATALWILGAAWLHAITILDFDWRYRLPLIPLFILLAACGIEVLVRRFVRGGAAALRASPVA